ncbi:MAG: hypothetical protein ACLVL7_01560 [Anaerotruncus massiliensis (ex Togo et al. 2019)]
MLVTPAATGELLAGRARIEGFPSGALQQLRRRDARRAAVLGFEGVLLVGHLGKFVKLAGGIFQTHPASRTRAWRF